MNRYPLPLALTTIAVLALLGPLAAVASATAPRTITVAGTGIVTSVPDEAQFSFGVSTNGQTATAALTANSNKMNKVIAAIKALGIPAAGIQTAQISLTPNTNQAGTAILDYTATDSVSVSTKHIATAGSIIDAAVGAGSNLVGGPSLTPSDQQLLGRRALKAAIADARARAAAIAQAANVKLGRVLTVTEVNSTPIVTEPAAKLGVAASTPVEPGTVQTEEDVTVTFGIG